MKKIMALSSLIILLCGYLYYHYHSKKPFHCEAQIISHIERGSGNVEMSMYADIVISFHDESVISLTGSIKEDDKDYIVNRTIFFTLLKSELVGINKSKIIRENKSKNDEVPDVLWSKYVITKTIGDYFNTELKPLNKNAILLQELSNPMFVCTKLE